MVAGQLYPVWLLVFFRGRAGAVAGDGSGGAAMAGPVPYSKGPQ